MENVQRQEFYSVRYPVVEDLERNYAEIKKDFQYALDNTEFEKWGQKYLYNEGWNVFGLRFQNEDVPEGHRLCPTLSGLLKKYDDLITTIGFSTLSPGTIIYPHVGYTDEVLRCHLGISVPEGDCCLKVGGIEKRWEEGRAFVFDDTFLHEAWNKTTKSRTVLLLDLRKEVLHKSLN